MIKYCDNFHKNLEIIKKMYEESDTRKIETFDIFEHRIRNLQEIEKEKKELNS